MAKDPAVPAEGRAISQTGTALKFVVLIGIVSLFADMTYEGARSITGPFLAYLGASAAVVGLVAGLGEFIGYALRIASGYLADRTGRYWLITLWGYGINLIAVPLLALAGSWPIAALLIFAERFGKAIRTPARDAMLSHATAEMGRGWGFALHEALDQVGALTGPLIVAAVLYCKGGYTVSFGILIVPALLALSVLATARWLYPQPRDLEVAKDPLSDAQTKKFPRVFWLYLAFTAVSVAGYAHFQLISYHFADKSILSSVQIPIFFAIAMGVDALVALIAGRLFDRIGLLTLLAIPLLSLPITPLVFSLSYGGALAGMILWGAVMGIQESIMRAAIAEMIPATKRGTAYGIFNAAYGLSWFLGSALMGVLYEANLGYLIAFSIVLELASLPLLLIVRREVVRVRE